jgi:hypothetical protein
LPSRERRKSPSTSTPPVLAVAAPLRRRLEIRLASSAGPLPLRRGARASAPAGSGSAVSSRAASFSLALSASARAPYFAKSGEALAAASTSSAGPIRDAGARSRVCTTGIGTPSSERIVTAASPIPIEVSSSFTS